MTNKDKTPEDADANKIVEGTLEHEELSPEEVPEISGGVCPHPIRG